jgi:hypothetical protein
VLYHWQEPQIHAEDYYFAPQMREPTNGMANVANSREHQRNYLSDSFGIHLRELHTYNLFGRYVEMNQRSDKQLVTTVHSRFTRKSNNN